MWWPVEGRGVEGKGLRISRAERVLTVRVRVERCSRVRLLPKLLSMKIPVVQVAFRSVAATKSVKSPVANRFCENSPREAWFSLRAPDWVQGMSIMFAEISLALSVSVVAYADSGAIMTEPETVKFLIWPKERNVLTIGSRSEYSSSSDTFMTEDSRSVSSVSLIP